MIALPVGPATQRRWRSCALRPRVKAILSGEALRVSRDELHLLRLSLRTCGLEGRYPLEQAWLEELLGDS